MIIDKKGKLFGKVNIIDLCIVVFVILAVFVTVFKFSATPGSTASQSNAVFEYSVKVSDVREFTAKQFEKGDNVYDDESGKYIGKIIDVKITDAKAIGLKSDGTHVESTKPERFDAVLTIETNGTINDTGYFADGVRQISPHSTIILSNNKFKTTGKVEMVNQIK